MIRQRRDACLFVFFALRRRQGPARPPHPRARDIHPLTRFRERCCAREQTVCACRLRIRVQAPGTKKSQGNLSGRKHVFSRTVCPGFSPDAMPPGWAVSPPVPGSHKSILAPAAHSMLIQLFPVPQMWVQGDQHPGDGMREGFSPTKGRGQAKPPQPRSQRRVYPRCWPKVWRLNKPPIAPQPPRRPK